MNFDSPNADFDFLNERLRPKLAIIDTNVFVSGMLSLRKNYQNSPSLIITRNVYQQKIVPIYSEEIFAEYANVFSRPKLKLTETQITSLLISVRETGLKINPKKINPLSEVALIDVKDFPFYEAFLETYEAGAYLITSNLKHFPINPSIISPRDALTILDLS